MSFADFASKWNQSKIELWLKENFKYQRKLKKLIAIFFPGPSKKKIPLLKELVFENLKDPISSVRQGAAQGETILH